MQKVKMHTRRQLRASLSVARTEDKDTPLRLSKRFLKQNIEIARNTAGCAPDFLHLP